MISYKTTTTTTTTIIIIDHEIYKFETNMSAATIKKPYSCGDKGSPEPLSTAAQ